MQQQQQQHDQAVQKHTLSAAAWQSAGDNHTHEQMSNFENRHCTQSHTAIDTWQAPLRSPVVTHAHQKREQVQACALSGFAAPVLVDQVAC